MEPATVQQSRGIVRLCPLEKTVFAELPSLTMRRGESCRGASARRSTAENKTHLVGL